MMKENLKKTENIKNPPRNRKGSVSAKQMSCHFSFFILIEVSVFEQITKCSVCNIIQ